jgi:hypothetical protein
VSELSTLRDRWQETGEEGDLSAYLRAWAEAEAPVPRVLEVAARFGSEPAAKALGVEVADPPPILQLHTAEDLRAAFGSWEAGFVYFLAICRFVRGYWIQQDQEVEEAMTEISPILKSSQDWFDKRRAEDAATALLWGRAAWAQAELLEGRLEKFHSRGVRHLVLSLGMLAYVCAEPKEPLHRDRPQVSTSGVSIDEIRFQRVLGAHFEVREAVKGVMYAERPDLNTKVGAFRKDIEPALARFEARAASTLARWLLAGALIRR